MNSEKTKMVQHNLPSDGIILLDGSARGATEENFCWETYNASSFSNIPLDKVLSTKSSIEEFIELIGQPNVWTIPQVSHEFAGLLEHIGQKMKALSDRTKIQKKTRVYLKEHEGHKEYLEELQQRVWQAYRQLRAKEIQNHPELRIDKHKLELLVDMVKEVSQTLEIKSDTSYSYYYQHKTNMSQASDTDERLVATLFYLSMFHNQQPTILTRDADMLTLLRTAPKFLGAIDFYPDNRQFAQAVAKTNPPRAYYLDGDFNLASEGSVALNTYAPGSGRIFDAKREEMMKELGRLWWAFSAYGNGEC